MSGRGQHSVDEMFAIKGEPMMIHDGRSVVRVELDGVTHYLKRYWFTPQGAFKRLVAQGVHELGMIDWLNDHGFTGPLVVDRGWSGVGPLRTRMFFLMRQVEGEYPLERYYRKNRNLAEQLLAALAERTARLHDRAFYHRDFSERHLLVSRDGEAFTFRQIDLERARVGRHDEAKAAADLKTLACSVADQELRRRLETELVADYLARRDPAPDPATFRTLLAKAKPTKTFW